MSQNHSFDWHGISFAGKFVAGVLIIGTGLQLGLPWLGNYPYPTTPHVELRPIAHLQTPAVEEFSTSTPERILNALTIADVIPATGKFIAADLTTMKLTLFENGSTSAEFPIKMKGRAGTPWETPSGFYSIQTKEENHFSTIGKVYMPYSMQFYGNYFIHGMTYYPDGTPTSATFSGGCIKLETADAEKVFAFADVGTKVFVYDSKNKAALPTLSLNPIPVPDIVATAYLVADIDTGDVYAEHEAQVPHPIMSITKLMTSLVANETISLDKKVTVPEGVLSYPPSASTTPKTFLVDTLFYPLLMHSSDGVAQALAGYYGSKSFVRWMNATAQSLDMTSTSFADAAGSLQENISTTEDIYRLAAYLTNKKSFVLKIANTETKTITAESGDAYQIQNFIMSDKDRSASSTQDSLLSVVRFTEGTSTRQVAVIVLGSADRVQDTKKLSDWIIAATKNTTQSACVGCTKTTSFRKIQL